MTIEEKIEFWTNSLIEDHSVENVRKFMEDTDYCTFSGHGMSCPICSHGCFKISVLWNIGITDKDLADEIMYTEMTVITEPRNFE